tara:strand:- start:25 stop:186 length:162 start_codon:yes stop_codon:yes gene_type:complete
MSSKAFDDFFKDCFISGDEICNYKICNPTRFPPRENILALQIIEGIQNEKEAD